ncbi:eaa protein [Salmonella enterica subsp. enterica serovar Reading]|nr:eaa protein [Salmonella enterica]MCO9872076.1 eaa protein [Salmonella enterica subsp. enterica serovar Reading]MCP0078102.1 eaa protein [Salmonella enterica subsp. enterica serovar Reading]MCP0094719.1 eaa protein [Salmonella enterica subsp. enterica serovar Reading]MCP0424786.1 eaa protein [Salmonella enterica subsp. enterica serovar Reading]
MDVKDKVLYVMRKRKSIEEETLGIFRKFSVATWSLRLSMVNEFPDDEWTAAKLRKVLISLCKDGLVSKDLNNSRIGNSVWILEENHG